LKFVNRLGVAVLLLRYAVLLGALCSGL